MVQDTKLGTAYPGDGTAHQTRHSISGRWYRTQKHGGYRARGNKGLNRDAHRWGEVCTMLGVRGLN